LAGGEPAGFWEAQPEKAVKMQPNAKAANSFRCCLNRMVFPPRKKGRALVSPARPLCVADCWTISR